MLPRATCEEGGWLGGGGGGGGARGAATRGAAAPLPGSTAAVAAASGAFRVAARFSATASLRLFAPPVPNAWQVVLLNPFLVYEPVVDGVQLKEEDRQLPPASQRAW